MSLPTTSSTSSEIKTKLRSTAGSGGNKINAVYNDGTTKDIWDDCVCECVSASSSSSTITITYTENGRTVNGIFILYITDAS